MARGLTKAILLAVLMNLLMLGVSASPTTGSMNPLGDFDKMDASLEEYIASDDSNTDIEVIFQLIPLSPKMMLLCSKSMVLK